MISDDPRSAQEQTEDSARADRYAPKGTLMHFLLRMGFFPHDEADAEAILVTIIRENQRHP